MEEVIQPNIITIEICNELNEYKKYVKKDMTSGETKIITGVELVEKFIRVINPDNVNDKILEDLEFLIENYKKLKENKSQVINNYVLMGISISYNLVSLYVKNKKQFTVKRKVLK